jgi:malonyl CoA-acyl carrier protein transacylase
MRSLQLSAQFGGHGQGFASRLERALAGDDAGLLLELQVSALEELDCAPTDALARGDARLDGWCHVAASDGGALTEQLCTAVAVFAAQASNFALFNRLVQDVALPFKALLGHSQGLANAVLAGAGDSEQAYIALARCASRKRARAAGASRC